MDATALVRQVTYKMRWRGPDGLAHWSSGPVALGHCQLRATPEAASETQPLVDPDRGLALVWDGRLDNRDELHDRLRPRFPRQGTPDPAYVLEAYTQWGAACPTRLEGNFAFAIWDARRRSLFCARDLMGGGQFTYVSTGRLFAFASDWDALAGLPGVSNQPNEDRIAGLLLNDPLARGDRRTWQQDVLHLWGGESLEIGLSGEPRIRQFASVQPATGQAYSSVEESSEQFQSVFGNAVRARLRIAGDPALMLSGGVDTAGLLAMTRRLQGETGQGFIDGYSAIHDQVDSSRESVAIQTMAALPGVRAHRVSVPSFSGMVSLADLLDIAWARAHPVDNSILIPTLMYLAASRDGARLMLHGASGDMTLSSPQAYIAGFLRRGWVWHAWQESRAASRNHVALQGMSPVRIFGRNAATAFLPAALKRTLGQWRRRDGASADQSLVNPEFAARIRLFERIAARFRENASATAAEAEAMRRESVHQWIMAAMTISARAAGRFGIEARDPWADRKVVEFFLGLPVQYKVREGWTKYLVRQTFRQELPAAVLWRRDKEHLGSVCTQRLVAESGELINNLFNEDLSHIEQYIDGEAARGLYTRYRATDDPVLRDTIFRLATLIMWLKRVNSGLD